MLRGSSLADEKFPTRFDCIVPEMFGKVEIFSLDNKIILAISLTCVLLAVHVLIISVVLMKTQTNKISSSIFNSIANHEFNFTVSASIQTKNSSNRGKNRTLLQ